MDNPSFLKDIYPNNVLYAVTIRSPIAKGYLILIHHPKLPAGYTLVTARNIPGENRLSDTEMPILASGKLSYIGEPVALLFGPDKNKLDELAVRCVVMFEEEKPVFSYKDVQSHDLSKEFIASSREIRIGGSYEKASANELPPSVPAPSAQAPLQDASEEQTSAELSPTELPATEQSSAEQPVAEMSPAETAPSQTVPSLTAATEPIHAEPIAEQIPTEPAPEAPINAQANVKEESSALHEHFIKSGKIATGSYTTGIQDHWYAEPLGALAFYKSENIEEQSNTKGKKKIKKLIIKTATQWSYHVKRSVARAMGIDQGAISVEPTQLNLHMDGKLFFASLVACHAALGTYMTKKPVRLILNREEDFLYSPKRFKSEVAIVSAIEDNGSISAAEIDITVNLGAHGVNSEEILDRVCLGCLGYYNFEKIKLNARAIKTNIPPQGPFSGFGLAQGFFAIERHISQIADTLKEDPALWRKARVNNPAVLPLGASAKNLVSCDELIDATVKMSDYSRKWASYELLRQSRKGKSFLEEKTESPRGIGIALGFQGNGLLYHGEDKGIYTVEVTLTKDSILEIKTSITSADDDFSKIWAKVASETMSMESEMVRVISIDTPDCGPSCASRNISVITKLVKKCCIAIRKQRFHAPLPITVRRSLKPQSGVLWNGKFPSYGGKVMDINCFSKPGLAAAVVEVSIDLIECLPKIRGIWLGIDGGNVISKNRARRSITRSATQAVGWAFTEQLEYENGVIPRSHYSNYTIPSLVDIPPIRVNFLPSDSEEHKGIGELPFTCIPAAFLQAVSQAMDHCYKSIPLKRSDVWDIVRFRNSGSQRQE